MVAWRFSSSRRSAESASDSEPFWRKPVARPVSASSSAIRAAEYLASLVSVLEPRSWPMRPAACQVVPEVSRFLSSSTTSRQPSFAR